MRTFPLINFLMKCYYDFYVESLLIIKKTPFHYNNSVYLAVQYEQLVENHIKSYSLILQLEEKSY